jgi:hypothetical protein
MQSQLPLTPSYNPNNSSGSKNENRDTGFNTPSLNQLASSIKNATASVKASREELEKYLLTRDIKLVTSYVEFIETNSFINSSYVMYLKYDNKKESFGDFLVRYPEFEEIAYMIEDFNQQG